MYLKQIIGSLKMQDSVILKESKDEVNDIIEPLE